MVYSGITQREHDMRKLNLVTDALFFLGGMAFGMVAFPVWFVWTIKLFLDAYPH